MKVSSTPLETSSSLWMQTWVITPSSSPSSSRSRRRVTMTWCPGPGTLGQEESMVGISSGKWFLVEQTSWPRYCWDPGHLTSLEASDFTRKMFWRNLLQPPSLKVIISKRSREMTWTIKLFIRLCVSNGDDSEGSSARILYWRGSNHICGQSVRGE